MILRKSALAFVILLTLVSCSGNNKPIQKMPPENDSSKDAVSTAQQIRDKYMSLMVAGKAHYENRSTADAMQSFEQAVSLLPSELAARLNLARACLLAQANDKALANAKQALQSDSRSVAALYLCGLASLRLEKSAQAVSYLERAAQLDPSSSTIHFQLANALRQNKETARANDQLRTVLQLDPDHWSANFQLAAEARLAGDAQLSQKYMDNYQRLLTALPDSQKAPEALERCIYTVPEVPPGIHQPPTQPIPVRFAAAPMWTGPNHAQLANPIVMLGIEPNGSQSFLACDAKGDIQLVRDVQQVRNQTESFEIVGGPLIHVDASEPWQARIADYNNDGLDDVFLFSSNARHLLAQESNSSFSDESAAAGMAGPDVTHPGARDALWLDFDHDGDVDLLIADSSGRLGLWLNRGNGTFVDESATAEIPKDLDDVQSIAAGNMNDDESIDVVLATSDGTVRQLTNDGLGIFSEYRPESAWPNGTICAVEDLDNDLRRDVAIAAGQQLHIVLANGQRTTADLGKYVANKIKFVDYDNDGWLDVLVLGHDEGNEPGVGRLRLFRNAGAAPWQDVTTEVGLNEFKVNPLHEVSAADLDNDGDTDFLATATDGSGMLLRNDGGNRNGQLKLRLRGTRSNRSAIGTLIEIRSGSFRLSRMVFQFPIEIGIAELDSLDSVKTIWPNGIVKNDIWVNPKEILNIEEPFVSAGSCPYLYAWDGQSFHFVTDVLGASPLGLSLRRGTFVPADTNEFVWLGDDRVMQPDGDGYKIQIADELREILYLDHVELVVIDHPPGTEAHPSTKLRPPPFAMGDIWVVEQRKNLLHAVDSAGTQWTDELQQFDDRLTEPPQLMPPQLRGLTQPHRLELDFGPIDTGKPLVLALTGWLQWGDASVNIAASQNPDLANPWPKLEAWTGNDWTEVNVTVGLPAGKTKTILVDLDSVLPAGTLRLRLTTAYEVYWDRISLFVRSGQHVNRHALPVVSANLQWRGFPKQIRRHSRAPITSDPTMISPTAPWRTLPVGWCTRYGDVAELVTERDDRLAILNGGDGLIVKFAGLLPELPADWHRDFFVQLDGWDKDSDYNVRCGNRVEPLPRHDMDQQRYGELPEPETAEWMKRYNTRWTGPRLQ